ncbi:hypothetical protein BVRB_1g011880 isoform B [Beta vulgaris subsp. vulgaris]|nr:hypothetical protein BVRB_1g011880 isoform B [Beta vulgaris subsp. vulgaris]
MDFHGLKRKKLQALCKKHRIPANLKNSQMAERLYTLLKDEKPTKMGKSCLKNLNDVETDEEVVLKKVKFSPQNETFFFEKTDPREMRLLARKERGFQKPEIEENPVSFSGNSSVGEVKNVGNVEKPAERIQRRKSMVVNSDTVLNSKAVNNVEKPVERVLRRRSVVVTPSAVLQPKIVDDVVKPVERILRRRSVVVKTNAVLDSKIVDTVVKPVERILRRRSVVVKKNAVLDSKIVDTVVKPVERVLRRKSVVGNVEKQCGERGVWENNLKSHGKKTGVEDIVLSPCIEEGKLSRIGEQGASAEADRQSDKLVDLVVERKQLKRTKLLADIAVNVDNGVGVSERNNLAEEGQVRRSTRQVQNLTASGCKSGSKKEKNDGVLDQAVVQKVQQNSPEMGPGAKKGKRGRKITVLIDCSTENPGAVEIGYVVDKETILGDSAPAQSLSESEEHNINEQYHATGHSISAEKKVENVKESTDLSPKSSEKLYVMFNTLEDSKDKRDSIDKFPKKAVDYQGLLLQKSGNIEAEGSMQVSEVKESFVADKSCYNDTAFTPLSNLKGQFSDTMFDFLAEQTCAGADEPTCHSTMKPSMPGSDEVDDSVREKASGALSELRGGMSDIVIDNSEELKCYNQNKNELLSKQEHECEKFPCSSDSSKNENAVGDEVFNCASAISERSNANAKPVEQELAAGSCDGKFREVEQTFPELLLDLGSSNFVSSEVVLVPEASIEANVQSPIGAKRLSLSSNALAASLIKPMEEGKYINVVKQTWFCGIDSSSSNGEDPHVVQLRNRCDSSYLQSEVDGEISVLSGSVKKGEDSCKETRRGEIACSDNSIKVNTFAEEDNPICAEQLHEVNVNLEAAGNIITNSNKSSDLKSEKAAWDAFPLSNGGKTPVLFQEGNSAQIAYEDNVCPGVMGSTRDKAFECISDKTKYLKQTSVDAVTNIKHDISFPKNNCSDPVISEDRELSEASHPENAVSCLDVESICVEVSERNLTVDTINAIDKLEFHLEDDDTSADRKILLQKETFHQQGNLCDNFNAQSCELSVLSGSMMEESHKETPRGDVTCVTNDGNVEYVSESDKYVTNMQPEDPKSFYEPYFQNLVSVDDITNNSQSEDLESERIACATEENLRAWCDKVETPVLFQKIKPTDIEVEGNTLVYDAHIRKNVSECIKTVSEQTKDLEHIVADDAEDRNDDVILCAENNVITFAESSYIKNAISSADFKSISSEISEKNLIEGTVDETSAYVNNNTCNIPVEPMVNQMPKVSHARDASLFTTQEKIDFRLKNDNFISQASKSADSVENKVESLAQETGYVEEAEGANTCGNESPESINCDKLDGALRQTSTQHTTFVGSVKEFEYLFKQAGSVVGATEGANSYEKESLKSNSERESGEDVELGVVVLEEGKSDVRVCSGHSAGKDFGSYCSLKTNSGKSSLGDAALVLDDDSGTIAPACPPPIDRKSTCYFADVCAATSEVASDSLQISEENKWNDVLQNACIGDIEGLHSGDKVEPESEKSDACVSSRDTEYQGLISSPFSFVNGKKVGTGSNYDADIAEPREDNYLPMVESHYFCENEKGSTDIEVALEYVPEYQSH